MQQQSKRTKPRTTISGILLYNNVVVHISHSINVYKNNVHIGVRGVLGFSMSMCNNGMGVGNETMDSMDYHVIQLWLDMEVLRRFCR